MNQTKVNEVFESAKKSKEVLSLIEKYKMDSAVLDSLTVLVGNRGEDFADSQASYFTDQNRIMIDDGFVSTSTPQQIYDVLYHEMVHYLRDIGGYDDDSDKTYSDPLKDPAELAAVREDVKVRLGRGQTEQQVEDYLRKRYTGMDVPETFFQDLLTASLSKVKKMSSADPEITHEILPVADEYDFTTSPSMHQREAGDSQQVSDVPLGKSSPNRLPARISDPTVLSSPLIVAYGYLAESSDEAMLLARENAVEFLSRLSYAFNQIYPHVFSHDKPRIKEVRDSITLMRTAVLETSASFESNMETLRQVLLFTFKKYPYLDQHMGFLSHQLKNLGMFQKTASSKIAFDPNSGNSICECSHTREFHMIMQKFSKQPQIGPCESCDCHEFRLSQPKYASKKIADLPDKVHTSENEPAIKQQVLTPGEMSASDEEQFTRVQNPEYALSLSNLPFEYSDAPDGDTDLAKYLKSIAMKNADYVGDWLDSPRGKEAMIDHFGARLELDLSEYSYEVVWTDEDEGWYEAKAIIHATLLSGHRDYILTFSAPIIGGVDKDWDSYEGPITTGWKSIDEGEIEFEVHPVKQKEASTKDKCLAVLSILKKNAGLVDHAQAELELAGLFDTDSDYDGRLGPAILKLVETFAAEGHSGMSAEISLEIFNLLAKFKTLTPITSADGWTDVSEMSGRPMWQSKRDPSYFSHDSGKTFYTVASAPGSKDFKFSSVQLAVPDPLKSEILKWSKANIPEDVCHHDDDAHGREDYPHITVLYGIHNESADESLELLNGAESFEVTLGKISLFANADSPYDVVKVEVESPDLHELNSVISEALEVTNTHPKYIPHMTIAYVKKGEGKKWEGNTDFVGKKFMAPELEFSSKKKELGRTCIPLKRGMEASLSTLAGGWDMDADQLKKAEESFKEYGKNLRFKFNERVLVHDLGEDFQANVVDWHSEEGWTGYVVRKDDGSFEFYNSGYIGKVASLSSFADLDEMLDSNIKYESDPELDKYPYGTRARRPVDGADLASVLKELSTEEEKGELMPRDKPDPMRRAVA